MKKINIIKIYDASNAHEAAHLIDKPVFAAPTLLDLYNTPSLVLECKLMSINPLIVSNHRRSGEVKYIAEFEEVEEKEVERHLKIKIRARHNGNIVQLDAIDFVNNTVRVFDSFQVYEAPINEIRLVALGRAKLEQFDRELKLAKLIPYHHDDRYFEEVENGK